MCLFLFCSLFCSSCERGVLLISPPPWSRSKLVPLFTLLCPIIEHEAAQIEQEVEDHRGGVSVVHKTEGRRNETRTRSSPWIRHRVCDPDIFTFPRILTISFQPGHSLSLVLLSAHASALMQSVTDRMLILGPGSGEVCIWSHCGHTVHSTRWQCSSVLLLQPNNHTGQICINTHRHTCVAYTRLHTDTHRGRAAAGRRVASWVMSMSQQ